MPRLYAPPEIRVLAADGVALRQVDRIAPFGVPTADDLSGLIRVEASLPSTLANAAGEVIVDLVALGAGGMEIRGAGDPVLIDDLPPTNFPGSDGLVLNVSLANRWMRATTFSAPSRSSSWRI